jgi:hypothetical protein
MYCPPAFNHASTTASAWLDIGLSYKYHPA